MFIKHEHLLLNYGLMGKLKNINSSTIKYYKGYYSKIKSLKILLLVLLMCMCAMYVEVPVEPRRACQITWSWSYTQLLSAQNRC